MADLMPKLQAVRSYIDEKNPTCELEVDGGINPETAKVCIAHGANVLVGGLRLFQVCGQGGVRPQHQGVIL